MAKTFSVRHLFAIPCLLVLVAARTGCNKEQAAKAEKDVRNAKGGDVVQLNSAELNALATRRMEGQANKDSVIYEVQARVERTDVRETSEKDGHVHVYLIVPEYAAATVRCEFALDHADGARNLKRGQVVTVRGKYVEGSSSRSEVFLNGCILVNN
jgi:hypothetical protein